MTQFNLHTWAHELAQEALEQSEDDYDRAAEFIHESCDGHEIAIYYGKAIEFCAHNDTSDGEGWLEECGGITQPGDTFGQIASRIAYATLYRAAIEALDEIVNDAGL